MMGYDIYHSPIGKIYVVVSDKGVCRIELFKEGWDLYIKENPHLKPNKKICEGVIKQIDEYFKGKRKVFTLKLHLETTEFRQKVWKALSFIPFGQTKSYQEIACEIGNPKAIRAVGQANKHNPLPLVIPCHRVIGKSGKLVGYAGDKIDIKRWLLQHEGCKLK